MMFSAASKVFSLVSIKSVMLDKRLSKEDKIRSMSSVALVLMLRLLTICWAVARTLSCPSIVVVAAMVLLI